MLLVLSRGPLNLPQFLLQSRKKFRALGEVLGKSNIHDGDLGILLST